ncbi:MAG: hypothetical protein N2C12_10425 [Planctomycetales bacterium]
MIEVWGEEVRKHSRRLNVRIPLDATDKEIDELMSCDFDHVSGPDWIFEESDSIEGSDVEGAAIVGIADDGNRIVACLQRDDSGGLKVEVVGPE